MAALNFTPRLTLLAMASLSLAGVAAALIGQYRFDMQPCPWCILQRLIYLVIAALCVGGALLRAPLLHKCVAATAGTLAALAAGAALYQHVVAAQSSSCNLTFADKIISALQLDALWPAVFAVTASCADAAVSVLGVPFAYWSLALAVLLETTALSVLIKRNPRR